MGRRAVWVCCGFAVAFALLAWAVVGRHGGPYGFDSGPHRWAVRHRPAGAVDAARVVTDGGTGAYPYVAAALGGWLGAAAGGSVQRRPVLRDWRVVAGALAVLLAGQILRTLLAYALHRARPPAADFATHVHGYSFPSGHTASSAIAAGLLAWGALRAWPGGRGRTGAAVCAVAALAVGCTRVYLGVHWPSDVLGGWLFAGFWLTALLPVLGSYADWGGGRRVRP